VKYTKEVILGLGFVHLGLTHTTQAFALTLIAYIALSTLEFFNDLRQSQVIQDRLIKELDLMRKEMTHSLARIDSGFETLETQAKDMQMHISEVEKAQGKVKEMAEESKKMISTANLGMGFRAAKREA
jgi:hypothetical protein